MQNHTEKPTADHEDGERDDRRARPRNPWIWMALAVAVVGVVIARNAGNPPEVDASTESAASGEAKTTARAAADEPGAQDQPLPRLVDLGAKSCVPCKMMAPILEELKSDYAQSFKTEFIDVWQNPDAAREYGIRVIPTQIFFDAAGRELSRHEGFLGKNDILAQWEDHGIDLSRPSQ